MTQSPQEREKGLAVGGAKKRGRPRSEVAIDQIQEMRTQGLSFRAIAGKVGLGYGTVRRAYWAWKRLEASAAD